MKSILFTSILLVATLAQARTVTCKQTAQNADEMGDFNGTFSLEIPNQNAKKITAIVVDAKGKSHAYEASFDDHDSLSDVDDEGYVNYHMDEDYDPKKEARFVSPDSDLAGSDGDSIIFMDKKILKGQSGTVSLSSGQPNDGDGGPAWIWSRNFYFNCK